MTKSTAPLNFYFIVSESSDGDLSLFVHAATPEQAVSKWREYFDDSTDHADDPVVFHLPEAVLKTPQEARAVDWDELTRFKPKTA